VLHKIKAIFPICFLLFISCVFENKETSTDVFSSADTLKPLKSPEIVTDFEKQMIQLGMVNINDIDSSIVIEIKYSTDDNFFKKDIYGSFDKAYLQPDVAEKLAKAQSFLKELHPDYSLIIYDAARPLIFQKMIWDSLKMPVREKGKFACNPKNGSLHNYGAAVDVSIIDENCEELDMGCPFDYFGELAYPVSENKLLSEGKLTEQQINNRKLLRKAMHKAGFFNIQTEWWHFNSCSRDVAKEKYKIIE
jgi:D-alanyl-D-alanine dipeptidase